MQDIIFNAEIDTNQTFKILISIVKTTQDRNNSQSNNPNP